MALLEAWQLRLPRLPCVNRSPEVYSFPLLSGYSNMKFLNQLLFLLFKVSHSLFLFKDLLHLLFSIVVIFMLNVCYELFFLRSASLKCQLLFLFNSRSEDFLFLHSLHLLHLKLLLDLNLSFLGFMSRFLDLLDLVKLDLWLDILILPLHHGDSDLHFFQLLLPFYLHLISMFLHLSTLWILFTLTWSNVSLLLIITDLVLCNLSTRLYDLSSCRFKVLILLCSSWI